MITGTVLLIRSKGFIPDQIRLHMAILAKRLHREPLPYNHAETVVMYKGQLMSMGARGGGAEMTPLIEYLDKHPDFIALEPAQPLTDMEVMQLEAYADEVCFRNKRPYQYFIFLGWVAKLKTWGRLNWGEKGDKRLYCYEAAALCAKHLNRWQGQIKLVSIYDLFDNIHYRKA